jgi:hypothetical protein
LRTAFFVHSSSDRDFATQLAEFLQLGCNVTCYLEEGVIGDGGDLIAKAEEGLCSDVLVLLLSPASSPARWPRDRWEPVLAGEARRANVEVVTVLLEDCSFPSLLRRMNFIDGTRSRLVGSRVLKRWFWQHERETGSMPSTEFSGDLEVLYSKLSDRPGGALTVGGADAWRFADEAAQEFEAVLWVPCQGRTLAQAAGELGLQLGLTLDGPARDNCRRIRDLLAARRCLVVLDGACDAIAAELTAGGRTSTAVAVGAIKVLETPLTPAYARSLLAARRYGEAYELLYRLLDAVIEPDWCARELAWICEHWDRIEEANVLRFNYGPPGGEQLRLF